MYGPDVNGLCGNDDAGQMSAWFLFSSLGFYPVAPGSGWYDLGAPLVRSAVIKVGDQILQIETEGARDGALVERILWNGEVIQGLRIHADQLLQGGTLRFEFKG